MQPQYGYYAADAKRSQGYYNYDQQMSNTPSYRTTSTPNEIYNQSNYSMYGGPRQNTTQARYSQSQSYSYGNNMDSTQTNYDNRSSINQSKQSKPLDYENNQSSGQFGSYLYQTDSRNREEREDDSDDDDDCDALNAEQISFYQELVDGKRRLNGDDPYWEMKSQLNGSLAKLFGKSAAYNGDESDWERPQTYGLANSSPIVPTEFNKYSGASYVTDAKFGSYPAQKAEGKAESKENTLYSMIQSNRVDYETVKRNNHIRSVVEDNSRPSPPKSNKEEIEEEYDEEGDEDDEDDDDEDGDYNFGDDGDEDLGGIASMTGLSPNLMALLGMKVEAAPVATDWKPPERAGLDNSDPLLAQKNMVRLQNGVIAMRNDG